MMFVIPGMMVLLFAAAYDVKTKRIPVSAITAAALLCVLTVVMSAAAGTESMLRLFLAGMPGALLLIIAFLSRESVGYGDGILMLCLGPVFGLQRTLFGVAVAFFVTALTSTGLLAVKKAGRYTRIPFVPFLASAMGVAAIAYR